MGDMIDSIVKNFERFLRWAYPGLLFLALLYVSRPINFADAYETIGNPWVFLAGGLGVGAALYLFQINVITQLPSAIAQWRRWDVDIHPNPTVYPDEPPEPKHGLGRLACWFNPQARNIEKRCNRSREDKDAYLDYAWGTLHATSITGWLLLAFFLASTNDSLLYNVESWFVIVVVALLLLGAFYLFLRLTRVRRPDNSQKEQENQ